MLETWNTGTPPAASCCACLPGKRRPNVRMARITGPGPSLGAGQGSCVETGRVDPWPQATDSLLHRSSGLLRFLGQNPERTRFFLRLCPQELPRNVKKCTAFRISRPGGPEIITPQDFPPYKIGTLDLTSVCTADCNPATHGDRLPGVCRVYVHLHHAPTTHKASGQTFLTTVRLWLRESAQAYHAV